MGCVSKICLADVNGANLASTDFLHYKTRQKTSSISCLALQCLFALLKFTMKCLPDRDEENPSSHLCLLLKQQMQPYESTWAFHSNWGVSTISPLPYYPRESLQQLEVLGIFYLHEIGAHILSGR